MKKNTMTVDPTMFEDELRTRQRAKLYPNCRIWFLKTDLQKLSFRFF